MEIPEIMKIFQIDDARRLEIQRQYGGQYIARRGPEVVAAAATYKELCELLDGMDIDWSTIIIEWPDPVDTVSVY